MIDYVKFILNNLQLEADAPPCICRIDISPGRERHLAFAHARDAGDAKRHDLQQQQQQQRQQGNETMRSRKDEETASSVRNPSPKTLNPKP